MSDFTLFEKAFSQIEENIKISESNCIHNDTVEEHGNIALKAKEEKCQILWIDSIINASKYKVYCELKFRKSEERNINKDVENMGFSAYIVSKANEIYSQVTKGQIFRGDSRKAVIFACIYHSYKIADKCQTPKDLMETFGLNKKSSLKGLKIVSVYAPKDSPIHTTSITAIHHINDLMEKFSATIEQKKEVINLYTKTKNRSSKLNRARPQSVSAALIYYWISLKKIDITLKKFAGKADLSELTINKNAKEVANVLGTPGIV